MDIVGMVKIDETEDSDCEVVASRTTAVAESVEITDSDSERAVEVFNAKRSRTRVSVLFTCCPPGPPARLYSSASSAAGITIRPLI